MPDDRLTSVRAFAIWTSHIATMLNCSYEDAAVFLTKMGALIELTHDADFQTKLALYTKATILVKVVEGEQKTPQEKGVH